MEYFDEFIYEEGDEDENELEYYEPGPVCGDPVCPYCAYQGDF